MYYETRRTDGLYRGRDEHEKEGKKTLSGYARFGGLMINLEIQTGLPERECFSARYHKAGRFESHRCLSRGFHGPHPHTGVEEIHPDRWCWFSNHRARSNAIPWVLRSWRDAPAILIVAAQPTDPVWVLSLDAYSVAACTNVTAAAHTNFDYWSWCTV